MAIHIQKIQTSWTKKSRGNPGAILRNRVPEHLPIETGELPGALILQEVLYNEGTFDRASKKEVSKINETQIKEHRLEFDTIDKRLEIGFWTEDLIKKNAGVLGFNSWCWIKTNRRFPMEYTWGYYKIVLNIFYGEIGKAKDIGATRKKEFEKDFQSLLK